MIASCKRRVLAWYVDLLLFTALVGFASFAARAGAVPPAVWAACVALFVVVRIVMARLATTPGCGILAIDAAGRVATGIAARESWISMTLATLLMLEGSKSVVRWADRAAAPSPLFGWIPDPSTAMLLSVVQGGLLIATATMLFRMMALGWWLALASLAASAASFLMSPVTDPTAGAMRHAARRSAAGAPVTAEHAEAMQAAVGSWGPASALTLYVACTAALPFVRRRYVTG